MSHPSHPSHPSHLGGPVSAALEADLWARVRRHGVVVWLDQAGHYTAFVDRLIAARAAGALKYDVRAFRGSHLELMLALDGVAQGADTPHLVLHLPGFTEESVRHTPIFEMYAAGVRYRKALDTLVGEAAAGKVAPDAIAAFKARDPLTLEAADGWLDAAVAALEGGLRARLRTMQPQALLDDLIGNRGVAGALDQPEVHTAVWAQLGAWLGLTDAWCAVALPGATPPLRTVSELTFAAASWALAVEYVDDLKRPPVDAALAGIEALPRPVIDACRAVAAHLRAHQPAFYGTTADQTEVLLGEETVRAEARDLGRIDTFRFEEEKVLTAALAAVRAGDWSTAAEWSALRLSPKPGQASFWLRQDPNRESAWQLVADATRLGQAIAAAGERVGAESLEAVVEAYVERGAAVDEAHRLLEQRRVRLCYPRIPEFEAVRGALDALRGRWRAWADAWARDFNAACVRDGFLPRPALQQRTLFDDVVRPFTREPGTTALFVVDALRFEMAQALYRDIEGTPATIARLDPRLAELPTVTEVGMNVLAPVVRGGRLRPTVKMGASGGRVVGFHTGEFRVDTPDTRRRAMHDSVGGGTCPWLKLDDVAGRDGTSLKRAVAQARLVVVHSEEIDKAGESGVGPSVFDDALRTLLAAWRLLRDAGVRRFVFTSDHGFLMLDDDAAPAQVHGRKIDPKRRHVISTVAADHPHEVRVPLADLGYVGCEEHVMFPETAAVFDRGKRPSSFVHGGNSLQERVIPVLTVVHRTAAGANTVHYRVTASAAQGVAGMHCLQGTIEVAEQGMLNFGGSKSVELGLRVVDADDVQVELVQARGGASVTGGVVDATVDAPFELFFRLSGRSDRRVLVEVHHPSAVAEVVPCVVETRFAVDASRAAPVPPYAPSDAPAAVAAVETSTPPPPAPPPEPSSMPSDTDWLDAIESAGVRQFFAHLVAHGTVAEAEAASMVGGARKLRRLSLRLEEYVRLAPFEVRVDIVGGVKRFVREGGR